MPFDKFGIPFFHPSKTNGFFWEMPDDPENDDNVDWPSEMDFPGDGVVIMNPNGPTDFGIGKNISGFSGSIDGCNMDFSEAAQRGYMYKADDPRDVELKCLIKMDDTGDNGFSISANTGRHSGDGCCEGNAYMITTEVAESPSRFNFRKEMWHVSYHSSPLGEFTHPKCNFRIRNSGKYVGIGFCRYNDPNAEDENVIVEVWFNPDPDANINDWTMLKKFVDHEGAGWGNDGDDCGGARDQPLLWSGAQNRFKSNATNGTMRFKAVTMREIDPSGSFDNEPPPPDNPPAPVPTTLRYTFASKWGTQGNGNGQFQDPHDLSFDSAGNVFVPDRVRNDIQKLTPTGTYISKFGSSGSGNGQFDVPYSIAHDASDEIYVCDRGNDRVQKLSAAGVWIKNITSAGGDALNAPEDLAFDFTNGDYYVTDTGNDRIVKFDINDNFLLEWGSTGRNNGQFEHPHSIDVDSARNVYIACGDIPTIQKFTPTGQFIKKWGSEGNGPGQVRMFLEHMDIDEFGRVHLINNDVRPIINVWDLEGNWLTQYGATTRGSADGQFAEPEHVTCQPVTGKPFVVDSGNHRIQIFNVNITTTNPPPVPPPPPPSAPSKVTGVYTLLRDINQIRVSACQGPGGGGGGGGGSSGGSAIIYGGKDLDSDKELCDAPESPFTNRIRIAVKVNLSTSDIKGKVIKQLNVALKRVGTPAATPVVQAKIWDSNGTTVRYTSPTNLNPSTLSTSFPADETTWAEFDFSTNVYAMQIGDRVGVEYLGTDSSDYVVTAYESDTATGGGKHVQSQYEGNPKGWDDKATRDFACVIWD